MIFDRVGKEIKPGVFVAYGHALGRSTGLRLGRVESVNQKKVKDWDWDKNKDVWVDTVSITVLGIDDDWESQKAKLLEKRSTLFFPERMVVVDTIPPELLKLYETNCVGLGKKHKWEKYREYYKKCSVCGYHNCGYLED